MTFEQWAEKYKMIRWVDDGVRRSEFDGVNDDCIWTEMDGGGGSGIKDGYWRVNAIRHYITELPVDENFPGWIDTEDNWTEF